MPTAQYAIAWIATGEAAFNGALRVLNPEQENHVWRVETPRDIVSNLPTLPTRYPYNYGVVNGQTVYLANALHEDFASRLAEIMVSKLTRKRIQVRMFLVSSLAHIEDYFAASPGLNNCIFDTFPPIATNCTVSAEGQRNAQRLLNAASSYYYASQQGEGYAYTPVCLYNHQDPILTLSMCSSTIFAGLPTMAFFGLRYRDDLSPDAQVNASTVAAIQIMGVLGHLEQLEPITQL